MRAPGRRPPPPGLIIFVFRFQRREPRRDKVFGLAPARDNFPQRRHVHRPRLGRQQRLRDRRRLEVVGGWRRLAGDLIGDQPHVGRADKLRIHRHAHLPWAAGFAHQLQILVGNINAVEFDLGAAILFQRFIGPLAKGIPGAPDRVDFPFRILGEDRPHLVGSVALHIG